MPLVLPAELRRAVEIMRRYRAPWGFAGGWAIDLFVGTSTRPHGDVDVAVLRDDQDEIRQMLAGAQVEKVVNGARLPWSTGERLEPTVHELHATWPDGAHLELVLNDRDVKTDEWIYRRDARIRLPMSRLFRSAEGAPYLAPEIALLFKSRTPGAKDDADLREALPHLDAMSAAWLRDAIVTTGGDGRWAKMLLRRG
jgi:hypothetical protein